MPSLVRAGAMVLLWSCLTACGGCDAANTTGDPWSLSSDSSRPDDASADGPGGPDVDGLDPDLVALDVMLPRDADASGLSVCEPRWAVAPGSVPPDVVRPIVVAHDSWFFLQQRVNGDYSLWRQTDLDGEPTLVREPVESLVDGGPRGVMFIEDGRVVLFDPATGTDAELAAIVRDAEWARAPIGAASYRFLDEQVLAWPIDGLWIQTAQGTAQLETSITQIPYVRDGYVAYGTPERLMVFRNARVYELLESNPWALAMTTTELFWVRAGDRKTTLTTPLAALATPPIARPLQPGGMTSCSSVAVSEDGETVGAACVGEDGSDAIVRRVGADGEWELVTTLFGNPEYILAADGEWVVYANLQNTPPTIMATRGLWEVPRELGPFDVACQECGAFWAPNYVELEGTKAAWNYAWTDAPAPRASRLGMAELCPR